MNKSALLGPGISAILSLSAPNADAITLKGSLPTGYTLVAVTAEGEAKTTKDASFGLRLDGGNVRLYAVDQNGSLAGPVILAVKRGGQYYTYTQARKSAKNKICASPKTSLALGLSTGTSAASLNLGTVAVEKADGIAYVTKRVNKKYLDKAAASLTSISDKSLCLPAGTGNTLGLQSPGSAPSKPLVMEALPAFADVGGDAPGKDKDRDGLVDALDVDKDGDGILNPYDPDTTAAADGTSFWVFSNLKLDMQNSLNQYTRSLTATDLNRAIGNATLAIQVAGTEKDTVELNCFGLAYCSKGGTGMTAEDNKAFPDEYDADGDGFGEVFRGRTRDFQLRPNVSSTGAIKGGDTYVEIITDATGAVKEIPGMLNFIFSTTPAIASLGMSGGTTTVTYPPTAGTIDNPFIAPAGWDGVLTVTAYRPQRAGIKAAGEGDFVDIGGSLVTIDLPNAPCAGNPCSGGPGPGNCRADAYTPVSADLVADPNGLRDTRADKDTDTAHPSDNQVSFTIDLPKCLAEKGIVWDADEILSVDLQFRNNASDNAAQNFRIRRQ